MIIPISSRLHKFTLPNTLINLYSDENKNFLIENVQKNFINNADDISIVFINSIVLSVLIYNFLLIYIKFNPQTCSDYIKFLAKFINLKIDEYCILDVVDINKDIKDSTSIHSFIPLLRSLKDIESQESEKKLFYCFTATSFVISSFLKKTTKSLLKKFH